MSIPSLPDVAGVSLNGTTYTISPEDNRAILASLGAPPMPEGRAHPVFYYIATQVGMGLTVAELCAACSFDVEDGPMMGTSSASFFQPLLVGREYRIRGAINGIVRKPSRKLGIMDIVEYTLHLDLADGTRACSTTNTWILPRGHDDAH